MPRPQPDPEMEKKRNPVPIDIKPRTLTAEMRKLISSEKAVELRTKAELDHQSKQVKEAEAAYLAEMQQKVLEDKEPNQVKRSILIDLPPEAPYLLTNGNVCYYPDTEYEVTKEVYDDLNSRMWMAWVNEVNRLDDKSANQYRRKLNTKISRTGVTHERFG